MDRLAATADGCLEQIQDAFAQASGKWTGCDWPTQFGRGNLNLDGLQAGQALLMARATSGSEAADWRAAVKWLTQLESDARAAEVEGRSAADLALAGKLHEGLEHAGLACAIERHYHSRPIWQSLWDAIRSALEAPAQFS